ncbi:MAG TPA: hypothetical protein VGE04_03470, partial [Chloroflexia bacterium]
MKFRGTLSIFLLIAMVALVGCDNGPAPATPTSPATATTEQTQGGATQAPTGTTNAGTTVQPTLTVAPGPGGVSPTEAVRATPTGTIVDATTIVGPTPAADTMPTATTVTARSTGDALTALQALAELRGKALAEMPDARLAMLVNSRP